MQRIVKRNYLKIPKPTGLWWHHFNNQQSVFLMFIIQQMKSESETTMMHHDAFLSWKLHLRLFRNYTDCQTTADWDSVHLMLNNSLRKSVKVCHCTELDSMTQPWYRCCSHYPGPMEQQPLPSSCTSTPLWSNTFWHLDFTSS